MLLYNDPPRYPHSLGQWPYIAETRATATTTQPCRDQKLYIAAITQHGAIGKPTVDTKGGMLVHRTDDNTRTLPIHYLDMTASLTLPYAVERWIEPFSPWPKREGEALCIWAWDPFQK